MTNLVRKFLSRFFGVRYVWIIWYDGRRKVCRVRFEGGYAWVKVYSEQIFLKSGGIIKGSSYLTKWEPYDPFAPAPDLFYAPSKNHAANDN